MPPVREAVRVLEHDGWRQASTRGGHRVFRHPDKPGIVVVAGTPSFFLPKGAWNSRESEVESGLARNRCKIERRPNIRREKEWW
ncbi:MAG: type II toxin-antitoxin system HicA family toxin [Chloroflexi bacterium]|nr:type II toxin-antitoxin system HicA family toxin [Chloroflexota bacterium]